MATWQRLFDRGTELGLTSLARIGRELRDARRDRGLSLAAVARVAGISVAELSRIERGLAPMVPYLTLARCTAVVGLDLSSLPPDPFETIGRPDTVIHLAWGGLPNYKSMRHLEHELPVQYEFLKALVVGGLRSLIVTGTCLEYGLQSGSVSG